jgi:hypothetical protein
MCEDTLKAIGFSHNRIDPCLFFKEKGNFGAIFNCVCDCILNGSKKLMKEALNKLGTGLL